MRDIYLTYTYLILSNAYTDSAMYNRIVIIYALNSLGENRKLVIVNFQCD